MCCDLNYVMCVDPRTFNEMKGAKKGEGSLSVRSPASSKQGFNSQLCVHPRWCHYFLLHKRTFHQASFIALGSRLESQRLSQGSGLPASSWASDGWERWIGVMLTGPLGQHIASIADPGTPRAWENALISMWLQRTRSSWTKWLCQIGPQSSSCGISELLMPLNKFIMMIVSLLFICI